MPSSGTKRPLEPEPLFAEKFRRTHFAAELTRDLKDSRVRVSGWIEDIRPLGSIVFLTVRDSTGVAQAVFRKAGGEEIFESALKAPRQSAVSIEGLVKESRAKNIPVEVEAEDLQLLAEATHPLPLDPTGRVDASLDIRLDARALDLRNERSAAIFRIRHTALQSIRRILSRKGFTEVQTPKIIGEATEGGATLFKLDYFGQEAYLAQSPQLYKEQLTLSFDRVFEVCSYFRAEKSHTRRHLSEFFSVDVEAAFADEDDVMRVCEEMVAECVREVSKENAGELETLGRSLTAPEVPFERITYAQAVEELRREDFQIDLGDDLPDHALRKLGDIHTRFFFVTEWPIGLKPFYIERKGDLSKSFDLQYGYLELASGGRRVSNRDELERRIKEAGLDPKAFSHHLKVFSWGMPPHSGWGMGFDRFMMVLTGRTNIREVVLYPRDTLTLHP